MSRRVLVRRSRFLNALGGVALLSALPVPARADTSPPSLRVRLFSGLKVIRLDAPGIALDAAASMVTQSGVTRPWSAGAIELSASPTLSIIAGTSGGETISRTYPGSIFVALEPGELLVVNEVDFETYVASVMSAEVSPGWAQESLRAQAIAVRTYAARARRFNRAKAYDLNDDTSSQVYPGTGAVAPSLTQAASDTAASIVTFGGDPASIFYSSSCGGHTAASEELTGLPGPLYLGGVADTDGKGRAYCARSPYFSWTNTVAATAMARVIGVPQNELTGIQIADRWPDGRVRTVNANGSVVSVTLSGRDFYERALGVLGYKVVPSAMFDISRSGDAYVITGHGVGHGVGMCQWGARGRADAGMSAEQILQAYFPGTALAHM